MKCDGCPREANTLYDLPEGFICLHCALDAHGQGGKAVRLLTKAAVTGVVNVEKRRRAIAKRTKVNFRKG